MVLSESTEEAYQRRFNMLNTIMIQEFMNLNNKEKVSVVDVREGFETSAGHIKNATLLPLSGLKKNFDKLNPEQTHYIICQSGGRSLKAAKFLSKKGYNVVNVLGGMGAYRGPVTRG